MSLFESHLQTLEAALPQISVDELIQWQEDKLDFVVIDVRLEDEYKNGSIPGAINMPRNQLEANIETLLSGPQQIIVVHCGSRGRSQLACQSLRHMGLDCSVLTGGYQAWEAINTEAAA